VSLEQTTTGNWIGKCETDDYLSNDNVEKLLVDPCPTSQNIRKERRGRRDLEQTHLCLYPF
jgi:hypothetical protein